MTIEGWSVNAEMREGLLHVTIQPPDGGMFCAESVQAHLSSEKIQLLIGAFSNTNHECALLDIQHHEGVAA